MSAFLQPTAAETRSNKSYEALLWAMSRPGSVETIAHPGLVPIVEALCDQEVGLFSTYEALSIELRRLDLRFVDIDQADYVVIVGDLDSDKTPLLRRVKFGTRLYPETSATIIAEARLGTGPEFALSGPGIDGRQIVRIGGIDAEFWNIREAACAYPLGWDAFLVDGTGVIGLPRSTKIEIL